MALTRETLYRGSTLRIHRVSCRPHDAACGPLEQADTDILVFPLRGLFVKHLRSDHRVVADACHALAFRSGEPYRVSHPVEGGDECLVLEPDPALRSELSLTAKVARLDGAVIAARKLLVYRLARRFATAVEAEERGLELLGGFRQSRMPEPGSRRLRSRRADIVEATQIELVRDPARAWTLEELAKRVYSSSFHLARTFRAVTGTPIHRYHLRARLTAALDEVLDTPRDLTTIALELGFSSHSHFTASFRAAFGATPSSLRRRAGRQLRKILTAA